MTIAICPGSYDPITFGHIAIIQRASKIFPQVIVALANNSAKNYLFTDDERLALARAALAEFPNVSVEFVPGLVAEFAAQAREKSGSEVVLLKGVRDSQDFVNETTMATVNHNISDIETLILPTAAKYAHISSSIVRELARYGLSITEYVPEAVAQALREKLTKAKDKQN
ncbi:MAG: pantetheine-phosphate adenylyltransferase [Arcanobacterium sp.]|nr:pantetheine-phosphate adenylyltransferase [Arcanobacterium sp.]